ncbi:MAG TPA: M56 family metallopeptidase [Longimicrobiales bacterium]|nr:M56 family metallopeptidase [Longimicrobiales bacterium]
MGIVAMVEGLLPAAAGVAVRGLVLLGIAWLLTLMLRRSAASLRHLVWTGALVGVLALPALYAVVPEVGVGIPWPSLGAESADDGAPSARSAMAAPGAFAGRDEPAAGAAAVAVRDGGPAGGGDGVFRVAGAARPRAGAAFRAGLVWLAGILVLLLPVGAGWIGVRRLEGRSRLVEDSRLRHLATRLALRIGLGREFRLLFGPVGTMPMTWGIVRPVVVLPPDARDWPRARLEAVLLHELAHVKRRDCLTQLLAEVVRAVHWVDPLAWLAARRLRVEREHACDDIALAWGARPSAYASELLGLARAYRASPATTFAAVGMARRGQLSSRLHAVLDESRRRGAPARSAVVRAAAVVAAATLGLAGAAPTAEGVAPTAAATVGAQEPTCAGAGSEWRNVQHQSNDRRSTIRMRRPGCELEVRLEGHVEFDPRANTIASLGRDASVRIEEDDGRTERRLDVRAGADGAPSYDYRVNGREAAFDGPAQAWYRAVLVVLFRRAGFAAEERVAAILSADGVEGVLRELESLDSGFVQAKYFRALVRQAELSEGQYRTVIRTAARRIDSDHYLAEILKAVAEHQPLTGSLLEDYVTASLALDSDHYRTETLRGVIRSGRLTGAQVAAVLTAAGEMDSDHYRSELLKDVADRYALEPAFRPAYLRAAAGLDSDHYRSEVLKRLLRRTDLSPAELAEVVAAARMIDSDHYRTEVLRQVAERGLSDATIQRAYFGAVEGIESDHYALEALRGLIREERLPADLLQAVLASAPTLESDHYLSELLVEIAERFTLQGATRDAFLRAMDSVESRHYRGRVADALLRAERP